MHSDVIGHYGARIGALPAADSRARTTGERIVPMLICLGMVASLIAFMSYQQAVRAQLKPPDELYPGNIIKSQLYYIAHGAEIVLLLSAGITALFSTNWRAIEPGYLPRFALFLGAVLLMTARGYSFSDLLSTKLADSSGPCPYFLSVLVFVGSRRRNWILIDRLMAIMAMLLSVLALAGIAGLHNFTRQEAVANLGLILGTLYWPASWFALKNYAPHSLTRRFRLIPIIIYGLGSILTQTRLLIVMLISALVMYAYLQHKRKIPQSAVWILGLILTLWLGLFTAVFLKDTRAFSKLENVTNAFYSRLDEDTRTGQVRSFIEDVRPSELILGRGSLATWNWGGTPWRGGTDIGYLTLLLYGGAPLLISYIVTHLKPGLRVFRRNRNTWQRTAAAIVLLWGIRMFSSSCPDAGLDYYPILFCTGACISRESSEGSANLIVPRQFPPLLSASRRPAALKGALLLAPDNNRLEAKNAD